MSNRCCRSPAAIPATCHGAFAGKKGFKLSLRGFDAEADHSAITRQAGAHRAVPSDPGRSLLLTKPTGTIAHKGGVRFSVDSPEYRVIADWIAAGRLRHEPTTRGSRGWKSCQARRRWRSAGNNN